MGHANIDQFFKSATSRAVHSDAQKRNHSPGLFLCLLVYMESNSSGSTADALQDDIDILRRERMAHLRPSSTGSHYQQACFTLTDVQLLFYSGSVRH